MESKGERCHEVSKFERNLRIELAVEVLLLVVMQVSIVSLRLLHALGISTTEDVVRQHSLSETCVSWERLTQLHILLALTLDHLRLRPLAVFPLDCLVEIPLLAERELVGFLARPVYSGLSQRGNTAGTSIRVSGTPTIFAAVLWKRSEGGRKLVVVVVTYLSRGWKSCPFTYC